MRGSDETRQARPHLTPSQALLISSIAMSTYIPDQSIVFCTVSDLVVLLQLCSIHFDASNEEKWGTHCNLIQLRQS